MCPECKNRELSEKYKFDIEMVKRIISDAGCKYISGEYLNNQSVLTLQCVCGAVFRKRFIKFQGGQNRCPDCGYMLTKGENSHLYKNGCSSVYSALRVTLLKWKALVRDAYDDTCPITGQHGKDCDVHHIVSLESIYKPIADKYGIEINNKTKISDLPNYQTLVDIRKEVAARHSLDIGILISKKIHYEYHSLYKGVECSETNFAEFLKNKYNVDLSSIKRREQANGALRTS